MSDIVITRLFKAPRDLVFNAWTNADHFAHWFGPRGSTIPFCRLNPQPGGIIHFCHRMVDGQEIWIKGVYESVIVPERIAFILGFADSEGHSIERPGFARESQVTIHFADEGAGTLVTVNHVGLVVDQGETHGWNESLDRLADHLAVAS